MDDQIVVYERGLPQPYTPARKNVGILADPLYMQFLFWATMLHMFL